MDDYYSKYFQATFTKEVWIINQKNGRVFAFLPPNSDANYY